MRRLWFLLPLLALVGCRNGTLPDPNDPKDVLPEKRAEVLQNNLRHAADAFNDRVIRRQLTDEQRLELLALTANRLLAQGDWQRAAPADAWRYADLLLTARRFKEAVPLLRKAVEYAKARKDDDRRVNDSLRLARALALTGVVGEGLEIARAVARSNPKDPGPVLPASLLEIAPAAEGKGHDLELARLLEDAIECHLRMRVDPTTPEGKAFLGARPVHIANAWQKIVDLYRAAGREDLANAAAEQWMRMSERLRSRTLPPGSPDRQLTWG